MKAEEAAAAEADFGGSALAFEFERRSFLLASLSLRESAQSDSLKGLYHHRGLEQPLVGSVTTKEATSSNPPTIVLIMRPEQLPLCNQSVVLSGLVPGSSKHD